MSVYSFTKTPVATDRLSQEIQDSSITIALDYINWTEDDEALDIYFKADLTTDEQSILVYLVTNHTGEPLPQNTTVPVDLVNVKVNPVDKGMLTSLTKPEGSSSTLVSHNFCNKVTWYGDSVRVEGETLETSDDLIYTSDHSYWINLVNGYMPYEDRISEAYQAKVYSDDVLTTTGFIIDYNTGSVTFDSAQTGKIIKADYSYATESGWYIRPSPGKILKLLGTQIKMMADCAYNVNSGHLYFQAFLSNGAPVGAATIYKNMCDLIKCASSAKMLPQFTGIPNSYIILDFDYITSKELTYSSGVYIKIWLSGHQPMTGSMGACTAHILSINE